MLDEVAAGNADNTLTSISNSYPSNSANSQASSSSSGSSDQSNNIFKDVGQQLLEDELQNKYPGIGPAIALLDGLVGAAGIINQDVIDAQHGGLTTTDYVNTGILAGGVVVGAFVGPEATVAIWAFDGTLFDVGL